MRKKASLRDIAEKVGVSTALVSYVLNNKKEGRISKEVALRIKAAAKELNYFTNQIARSLKTNKTYTIGLIVADISNPFSSGLARIIEDEAERNNYTVIFGSSDEKQEKCRKLIELFLNRQVDGLIIAPAENALDNIALLRETEIPFVLIDRYFPGEDVSYVVIDNYEASFRATAHLIAEGNRRIGMITYKTSLFHVQERTRGFREALVQHRLPVDDRLIRAVSFEATEAELQHELDDLLKSEGKVDALLFASNVLSTRSLKYINTLDLLVPRDLALVSFDESEASHLFYAPLTHIRQPLQQIGELATKTLLSLMTGESGVTQLTLSAELVVGRSSVRQPTPA